MVGIHLEYIVFLLKYTKNAPLTNIEGTVRQGNHQWDMRSVAGPGCAIVTTCDCHVLTVKSCVWGIKVAKTLDVNVPGIMEATTLDVVDCLVIVWDGDLGWSQTYRATRPEAFPRLRRSTPEHRS